jgi:hypothetical protein
MNEREETSREASSDAKAPWERPAVTLAGTISLLVRAGSALGKSAGVHDGDATNPRRPQ